MCTSDGVACSLVSLRGRFKPSLLVAAVTLLSGCAAHEGFRFPRWLSSSRSEQLSSASDEQGAISQSSAMDVAIAASLDSRKPVQPAVASASAFQAEDTELVSATRATFSGGSLTLEPGRDFHEFVQSEPGTVLVDFYADWCGPCRQQAKILQQLEPTAAKHGATILKVDVDEHPRLKQQYQVSALPTLLVIKNGQVVARQKGLTDASQLASWITN